MNISFVLFVQRHYAGGVGIDADTWPTEEEALRFPAERVAMLQQIRAAWDLAPAWQSHSRLMVEGDFEAGRWESGSRKGLLEFRRDGSWAGGGGSTDYAAELGA